MLKSILVYDVIRIFFTIHRQVTYQWMQNGTLSQVKLVILPDVIGLGFIWFLNIDDNLISSVVSSG